MSVVSRTGELFRGERYRATRREIATTFRTLVRRPMGVAGLAIIIFFVGLAVSAPLIVGNFPDYVTGENVSRPNLPPSEGFPLGTDFLGRSNWALLVYGARISIIVGFTASAVAMIIGTLIGVIAGYFGRWWDRVLSWVTDFFLVIPWLPFVLVIAAVLGRGFTTTVIAIAIVSWPTTARVIRSKVLSVKTLGYVQRARAVGAGDRHIMFRHIMPVLWPLIFANAILTVSNSIFTESFLAFFGFGEPARPSWGTMIQNSFDQVEFFKGAWWSVLPPGISITALVLAFAMVSTVLEEILNPRLRKR